MTSNRMSVATLLAGSFVVCAGAVVLPVDSDSSFAVDSAKSQISRVLSTILRPESLSPSDSLVFTDVQTKSIAENASVYELGLEEASKSGRDPSAVAVRNERTTGFGGVGADIGADRATLESASHSWKTASEEDSPFADSRTAKSMTIQAGVATARVPGELEGESGDLLVLYGPVSDLQTNSLNVLGQQFDSTIVWSAPVDPVNSVGRLAYVEAEMTEGGYDISRIELFDDYAVPGATTVLVHGSIGGADTSLGLATVGDLQVDVTNLNSSDKISPSGQVVIPGIQPLRDGVILGYENLVIDENLVAALATSRVVSISGSNLQSISGSNLQSISGSNLQSISGSNLQSISGSNLQSISGSNLQ